MPIETRNYADMTTNAAKRAAVEKNMKQLDYEAGNGLLSVEKRQLLPNENYLFIGSGGTGNRAVLSMKTLIEKTIDPACHNQTRYLVVDCAMNELNQLVANGAFKADEVLFLPCAGMHASIDPRNIESSKAEWVDPGLFNATGGENEGMHPGFDSNGAAASRQSARVRLTTHGGTEVINKISNVIGSMNYPAGAKLKIFFLCSVAGGTGSGTIVDLAYMTRHVLENHYSTLYSNTLIVGGIFSPTACDGTINEQRDSEVNTYAAMKEILYFMRLNDRGEKMRMNYGARTVFFSRNIFDTCFIVDGGTLTGSGYENPAQKAREVVTQYILEGMTACTEVDGARESLIDSLFFNSIIRIASKTACMPIARYPRYVGYKLNAMGFASVKVSIELLTSVLVYEALNQVWVTWNRSPDPYAEQSFLDACGIRARNRVSASATKRELLERIEAEARNVIRRHGITYMIELARGASHLLEGPDYIEYARVRANGSSLFFRDSWRSTVEYMEAGRHHLIELSRTVWETTRVVLESFRNMLRKEQGILTDVAAYDRDFNTGFRICPVNLTQASSTQQQANALLHYIVNDIYTKDELMKIAQEFVDDIMCTDNIERLVGIASENKDISFQFDPAGMIRNFIETRFSRIINENIETFLVKFFSADSNASVMQLAPNNPAIQMPTPALKAAAKNIYDALTTRGGATANIINGADRMVSGRRFITVPLRCRNLFEEIRAIAAADGNDVRACLSTSNDELVMLTMLEGLPAQAFRTIERSEQAYESSLAYSHGIHIEQCGDGVHNWVNLPNLTYSGENLREERNLAAARADYDKAAALGMILSSAMSPGTGFNTIFRLNKTRDVGSSVERLMEAEFDAYIKNNLPDEAENLTVTYCLNQLSRMGIVSCVELRQNGDVLCEARTTLSKDFYYDYSWHTLRQMFHLWHAVKATIPYVEKLKAAIERKRA